MYVSLDEARVEIKKRWEDVELRKRIEAELGDKFMPAFADEPRAIYFKQVASPDNGFMFYYQCAKYINIKPLAIEYTGDMFFSMNEEKMGLARLRVFQEDGTRTLLDIMKFSENEKLKIKDCTLKTGENLVEFHHQLLEKSGYYVEVIDNTSLYNTLGMATEYYYPMMLHSVAHGVLFESFLDEGDGLEDEFTKSIVKPTIKKILDKYDLKPIILSIYPSNQDELEDFYWWSYPQNINSYLLNYAKTHNLAFKGAKI